MTSTIPGFWQHVFDEASSSIGLEEHIHPEDTVVLSALTSLNVTRPGAANGDPRDLEFTFEFADNDYMPAQTLVKKFTYQEGAVTLLGQTGLVSEPVLVQFKKGKDLTSGLSAAAMEAWEERKSKKDLKGAQKRKIGEKEKKLAALVDKATSFFCWFSYTGAHKDLGEVLDEDEEEEEENEDDAAEENVSMMSPVEAFSYGDEVAIQLAEDLYPNAVKYFSRFFPFT